VNVTTEPAEEFAVEHSGIAPAVLNGKDFRVEQAESVRSNIVEATTGAAQIRTLRFSATP
jgi:hypothetical protein